MTEHLTSKPTVQGYADYPNTERNKYCTECGAKITIGSNYNKEYGHFPSCEYKFKPDQDPRGD